MTLKSSQPQTSFQKLDSFKVHDCQSFQNIPQTSRFWTERQFLPLKASTRYSTTSHQRIHQERDIICARCLTMCICPSSHQGCPRTQELFQKLTKFSIHPSVRPSILPPFQHLYCRVKQIALKDCQVSCGGCGFSKLPKPSLVSPFPLDKN